MVEYDHSQDKQNELSPQSILDAFHENICILDEKGNIIFVNEAWKQFGIENAAGIEGNNWLKQNYLETSEAANGEDKGVAKKFAQGIRSVIEGHKNEFELIYPCHAPEKERWFLGRVTPLGDIDTVPRKVVITHYNVTEKKELDHEFKKQFKLLQAALEGVSHPFYMINVDTYRIVRANSALGLVEDENWTCYAYTHNRSKPCVGDHPCPIATIKQTKAPATVEHIHYDSDGKPMNVEVHAFPVFNEVGEVTHILEYIVDITERKHLEEKLRESEAQLRKLVENVEAITWELDLQQDRWTYVSPQAEAILGYSSEEWTGFQFWLDRVHPEDRQWAYEYCTESTLKGEEHSFEYRFIKKDGSVVWLWENVNVEMDEKGDHPEKLRGLILNITERKEMEERLAAYTADIEAKKQEIEDLYQRLEKEIQQAKLIHESTFLGKASRLQNLPGVSLATHYQPAEKLGGDLYNFIKMKNQEKLIIYLSDVTGHGLECIRLSAFVKETIENYITFNADNIFPEKILNYLDAQYRENDYPDDYFISIFIGVLDLNTFELSYIAAGMQFAPLVKLESGACIELESKHPPVSKVIPGELMQFQSKSIKLSTDSLVLFYTDGLAEQERNKTLYETRLKKLFCRQNLRTSAEQIKHKINNDFLGFNGSLQGDDDITYVIMKIAR